MDRESGMIHNGGKRNGRNCMKRYAAFLKNIAALILLIALTSLLLPFCKITTATKSTTVSGMGILKIGAEVSYEYYKNGSIDEDYVIWDDLTWGEVKGSATYAMEHDELQKVVIGSVIASLPILFCFLSMILILMARGIKTMILPTMLIAMASVENFVLMVVFFKLQKVFSTYVDIRLLIGVYAFTALSAIALMILVLLWLTGGFLKPKQKSRTSKDDDVYDEEDDEDYGRKNRSLEQDKSRKKRQTRSRNKNKEKSKKIKRDKEKKKTKDSKKVRESKKANENRKNEFSKRNELNKTKTKNNEDIRNNQIAEAATKDCTETRVFTDVTRMIDNAGLPGITGLMGMYQGVDLEQLKLQNGTFIIGTTPEVMSAIQNGTLKNLDQIARYNCVIEYDEANEKYTVTSHSAVELILQTGDESEMPIRLNEGDSHVVTSNTLLYVGDSSHCIRLE